MSERVTRGSVVSWLRAFAKVVAEQRGYLTELDSAIGDADHGINMERGMRAVVGRLDDPGSPGGPGESSGPSQGDIGALFKQVGMILVSTVGGAAGPLYGTLFLKMGGIAGPGPELTVEQWAAALEAGVEGVQARGKAELGDKTMIDALVPAAGALHAAAAAGLSLADALRQAADAAEEGMKATTPLVARKGRASYLGERSVGHQDPGATSSWFLIKTAAETMVDQT